MSKSLIFDLDGTLWEVIDSTYNSANIISRKYNLDEISKDTICNVFGHDKEYAARKYFPNVDLDKSLKLLDEVFEINMDNLKNNSGNIYPNVKKVLTILSNNYDLYIVSNTAEVDYIKAFLDTAGVGDLFNDYIAASSLNISKADAIKKIINDNDIDDCVYIGDTSLDLDAAVVNDIPFIYAKYGFGKDLDTVFSINDLIDLPDVLDTVFI